jgi:hypothetical protein
MFAPGAMLSEWKARGKRAESAWKEGGGVSGFGRTTALMMPGPQAVDPSGTGERGAGLSESVKTILKMLGFAGRRLPDQTVCCTAAKESDFGSLSGG